MKDYVGKFDEDKVSLNRMRIRYNDGNNGSQAHRYWAGATTNNAVHEFRSYALQDNISVPPFLDIYNHRQGGGGAAIMTRYVSSPDLLQTINVGLWSFLSPNNQNLQESQAVNWLSAVALTVAKSVAPDVIIGSNFTDSDRLKRLAYHELAHASHYQLVGSGYWSDLSQAEIIADGHGDQFSQGAGLIAVVESWAEHIGQTYTHRGYPTNALTSITGTWQNNLERTRNERTNHIPIGIHHDLNDNSGNEANAFDEDDPTFGSITDQVAGFTNRQMFLSLNASVTTPDQYRIWLNNNFTQISGNNATNVNGLFSSY